MLHDDAMKHDAKCVWQPTEDHFTAGDAGKRLTRSIGYNPLQHSLGAPPEVPDLKHRPLCGVRFRGAEMHPWNLIRLVPA